NSILAWPAYPLRCLPGRLVGVADQSSAFIAAAVGLVVANLRLDSISVADERNGLAARSGTPRPCRRSGVCWLISRGVSASRLHCGDARRRSGSESSSASPRLAAAIQICRGHGDHYFSRAVRRTAADIPGSSYRGASPRKLQYGALAMHMGGRFQPNWLRPKPRTLQGPLDMSEFTGSNALYSIAWNARAVHMLPLELRSVARLSLATFLPFAPVWLLGVPFEDLTKKISAFLL